MSMDTVDTDDWSFKPFGPKEGLKVISQGAEHSEVQGIPLRLFALSPGSKYFAAGSTDAETGFVVGEVESLLAAFGSQATSSEVQIEGLQTHKGSGVLQLAFLTNGQQLVVATREGFLELYDVPTLKLVCSSKIHGDGNIVDLQPLHNAQGFVYSTRAGSTTAIYMAKEGQTTKVLEGSAVFTVDKSDDNIISSADDFNLPSGAGEIKWIGELNPGQYGVVAVNASSDDENDYIMYIQIGADKGDWIEVDEACPPFGDTTWPFAWFSSSLWNFPEENQFTIIGASSQSTDLLLIASNEKLSVTDESDKLPFTTDDEEIVTIGAALYLGSSEPVVSPLKGIDTASDLPIWLILTQEGRLLGFHIASRDAITERPPVVELKAKPKTNITTLEDPNAKSNISDEEPEEILPVDKDGESIGNTADHASSASASSSNESANENKSVSELNIQQSNITKPGDIAKDGSEGSTDAGISSNLQSSGALSSVWGQSGSTSGTGPDEKTQANAKAEEESKKADAEAKAKEEEAKEKEAREREEKEAREREAREKEVKEKEAREKEEKEAREREAREKEAKEKEAREKEEKEAREREAEEKEAKEREAREKEVKEREAKEREERERREKEAKEKEAREREAREKEAMDREARERETREREAREKEAREREAKENEAKAKAARLCSTEWNQELRPQFVQFKSELEAGELDSLNDFDGIYAETNLLFQVLDHNLRVLKEHKQYSLSEGVSSSNDNAAVAARISDVELSRSDLRKIAENVHSNLSASESVLADTNKLSDSLVNLSVKAEQLKTELDLINKEISAEAYYTRPLSLTSAYLNQQLQGKYAKLSTALRSAKQQALFLTIEKHRPVELGNLIVAIDTIDSRLAILDKRVSRLNRDLDSEQSKTLPDISSLSLGSPYIGPDSPARPAKTKLRNTDKWLARISDTEKYLESIQSLPVEDLTTSVDL